MKPALALLAVLVWTAPGFAESRSVLVVVTHDKDGKPQLTIHSDDKQDRREVATVAEACKAVAGMKGWGSVVNVFVVTDPSPGRTARRCLMPSTPTPGWT